VGSRNRLSEVTGIASFAYDAFDRRQTATRGGTATSFLYDDWDVVQEQQGGVPSADLVTGLGVDERFTRNGATFLADALGSTAAVASAGAVHTSYGYDPYGVAQVTGSASDNPFTYTGREDDGTGLLQYRNRYYSPVWGRFISEDPIGLNSGDVNLYRYVANNPVQMTDPSGDICPPCIALGALVVTTGLALCRAEGICKFPWELPSPFPTPSPSRRTPSTAYPDPCTGTGPTTVCNTRPGDLPATKQKPDSMQVKDSGDGKRTDDLWIVSPLNLETEPAPPNLAMWMAEVG
jgi:RHS repeat-associated protein